MVAYASRALNKAERNYDAHKLEFLALKWVVTDQFHEYLYGSPKFDIYTDNNPPTYILTTAKLDAMGHQWIPSLGPYQFDLHYKPGKKNLADPFSRINWSKRQKPHGKSSVRFGSGQQNRNSLYGRNWQTGCDQQRSLSRQRSKCLEIPAGGRPHYPKGEGFDKRRAL